MKGTVQDKGRSQTKSDCQNDHQKHVDECLTNHVPEGRLVNHAAVVVESNPNRRFPYRSLLVEACLESLLDRIENEDELIDQNWDRQHVRQQGPSLPTMPACVMRG